MYCGSTRRRQTAILSCTSTRLLLGGINPVCWEHLAQTFLWSSTIPTSSPSSSSLPQFWKKKKITSSQVWQNHETHWALTIVAPCWDFMSQLGRTGAMLLKAKPRWILNSTLVSDTLVQTGWSQFKFSRRWRALHTSSKHDQDCLWCSYLVYVILFYCFIFKATEKNWKQIIKKDYIFCLYSSVRVCIWQRQIVIVFFLFLCKCSILIF